MAGEKHIDRQSDGVFYRVRRAGNQRLRFENVREIAGWDLERIGIVQSFRGTEWLPRAMHSCEFRESGISGCTLPGRATGQTTRRVTIPLGALSPIAQSCAILEAFTNRWLALETM